MKEIDPNNLFDGNKTNDDVLDIAIDVPSPELHTMPGDISEFDECVLKTQEDVKKLEERIGDYRMLQNWTFFFRGHSDSRYKLRPTIIRDGLDMRGGLDISKEGIVIEELIEFGKSQQWDKFKIEDWDDDYFFLAIGRHLGLYSRMLDWTISLKNAVSFALHDNLAIKEKSIWILAVRDYDSRNKYNKLIGLERNKINISCRAEVYVPDDFLWKSCPEGLKRRFAQCGCFTIPHTDNLDKPLDKLWEEYPDENIRLFNIPLIVDETSNFDFKEYATNYSRILPDIPRKVQRKINMLNKKFSRSIVCGLCPRKKSKENM